MVLFVSVCSPDKVAVTVGSTLTVTAVDPLKLVYAPPVTPLPKVSDCDVPPVPIVTDPPNETVFPLIVIVLLVKAELGMLVNVLLAPLIDLLERVKVFDAVATIEVSTAIVPVVVIVPPVKPVPAVIDVTLPPEAKEDHAEPLYPS
jgi:hypothetical protein